MAEKKPLASLSLDLDNKWSYMKTHADPGWETFPSYLNILVPRILDFLEKRNLKITFFIVGQDAALEKNHDAIRSIAEAGHEIGTHSFNHEPWLHLYSEQQLEEDISHAEEHIERVTGQKPIGFRGPGYSFSSTVLRVLANHGYQYDASTLPTFLGPLARAFYFMNAKLSAEEKEQRKLLYGEFKDGFQPIRPYRWQVEGKDESLVEIPVTTMPLFKLPFHVSYILYISRFSPVLARLYFKLALGLCKLTRISPSLLMHPLDFLGCDDVKELAFFPAMDLSSEEKIKFVGEVIDIYLEHYTVVPLRQQVRSFLQGKDLLKVEPRIRYVGPKSATTTLNKLN